MRWDLFQRKNNSGFWLESKHSPDREKLCLFFNYSKTKLGSGKSLFLSAAILYSVFGDEE